MIPVDRSLEGPDRFFMVEGLYESEALIEIPLGLLRCGGDRMVERAEIVEERRSVGLVSGCGFRR